MTFSGKDTSQTLFEIFIHRIYPGGISSLLTFSSLVQRQQIGRIPTIFVTEFPIWQAYVLFIKTTWWQYTCHIDLLLQFYEKFASQ